MNAIETQALTKRYGDKTALESLSLTIPHGTLFSLLGVNGAGKTTTIKLLSCLIHPTSGSAKVYGHDILKEPQKVKALLGTSPQETAVAPNLTVRENLEMMSGIYGADRKAAKSHANQMIKKFRLGDVADKQAKKLSGGWQRLLSIAMALICEPKLLFLDEPTLGLDVLARRELWEVISELKGQMTIILTTHYLEEAEALSDRIGILANGRLVQMGTAEELIRFTHAQSFEDAFIALAGGKKS